jgi:hypothetical protein
MNLTVETATKANKKGLLLNSQDQVELQNILRNDHQIHVVVSPWEDTNSSYGEEDKPTVRYECAIIDQNDEFNTFTTASYYNAHEEALEAGLKEALDYVK